MLPAFGEIKFRIISIISLGNRKLKLYLQSFIMSMLDVLKSFIKNLVTAKSTITMIRCFDSVMFHDTFSVADEIDT